MYFVSAEKSELIKYTGDESDIWNDQDNKKVGSWDSWDRK